MSTPELQITSQDFADGETLAERFSDQGGHSIPQLSVSGVPEKTVELALIMHDPDAPMEAGFTHWIVYGLAARDGEIDTSEPLVREAANDSGRSGYYGPGAPRGDGPHRYIFSVYALSTHVEGTPGRDEFLADYEGQTLAVGSLTGIYERPAL